ncbi:MAG: hypothetical protein PUF97_00760 [Bifidobacteriaceae bacterium]|nr:hypothetical protein [Bifidobacteriaceae bacterium]
MTIDELKQYVDRRFETIQNAHRRMAAVREFNSKVAEHNPMHGIGELGDRAKDLAPYRDLVLSAREAGGPDRLLDSVRSEGYGEGRKTGEIAGFLRGFSAACSILAAALIIVNLVVSHVRDDWDDDDDADGNIAGDTPSEEQAASAAE